MEKPEQLAGYELSNSTLKALGGIWKGEGGGGGNGSSHPSCFTLKFDSLFGVSNSPFHKAYRLVHVALYAVNHSPLAEEVRQWKQNKEAEAESIRQPGG